MTELTVADVLAINRLVADYVFTVDERDIGRFGELWLDDAVWRSNRDQVGFNPPLHGRSAIVAAFQGYFDRQGEYAPGTFMRHLCTAPRIEIVDGVVHVKTGMLSVKQEIVDGAIHTRVSRTGVYRDRVVQDGDGRWRFAERFVAWDPPERPGVVLPVDLHGPPSPQD